MGEPGTEVLKNGKSGTGKAEWRRIGRQERLGGSGEEPQGSGLLSSGAEVTGRQGAKGYEGTRGQEDRRGHEGTEEQQLSQLGHLA
jgi:hypothetical protein